MPKDNFIPGIYNYCDRWCERCAFTSRCRTFERTSNLSPEQQDMNNKAFWDNVSNNLQEALKMLEQAAAEHGIDLNEIRKEETLNEAKKERELLKAETRKHPIILLCKQYQQLVMPFLNEALPTIATNRQEELATSVNLGVTTEKEALAAMATVNDTLEVIQWYVYFFDAKLQRALHGMLDEEDDGMDSGEYPRDSDGSAKIAIIAVENSMGAWARLYELLPATEDAALQALSLLSRIREQALATFPRAMAFRRPGFDDEPA